MAIVGGGISGLLACKYTLSKGYRPIVFESETNIGGVWSRTIKTTKLQTPKEVYQFSDFPWPASVTDQYPDHQQVLDYLQSYARHFDLIPHIRFSSRVVSIDYEGTSDEVMQTWSLWGGNGEPFAQGKWTITVDDTRNHSTQVYQAEFVILCLGRFSGTPNIPEFPPGKGPQSFDGTVIHSMDYADMDHTSAMEFIRGKRVAIVGLRKSAMDIAMECATVNGVENPCVVVYKTEHWNIPYFPTWILFLYFNRFAELLVHKPGEGFLLSILATILSPVRLAFSKFVESYLRWKLPLAKLGMVPKHHFAEDMDSCLVAVAPDKFYDTIEKGSIILKKSMSIGFCKQGICIDGEVAPIKTDLVIFATGFRGVKKLKDIVLSPTFKACIMGSPTATVPLYRECIHPRIPQLAIIGFSESYSNLYTSELRCRWLAELLDGSFKLPSIKEMEEDISKWDEYMKHYTGKYYRRSCIGTLHIWYNDQLCKDIGWNTKRKHGFLSELFEPYGPVDYRATMQ